MYKHVLHIKDVGFLPLIQLIFPILALIIPSECISIFSLSLVHSTQIQIIYTLNEQFIKKNSNDTKSTDAETLLQFFVSCTLLQIMQPSKMYVIKILINPN